MTQSSNQADSATDLYAAPRPTAALRSSINQKKMLSVTAATVLLGGAVGLVLARPDDGKGQKTEPTKNPLGGDDTQELTKLPENVDVAGKITDDMSFGQAFGAARDEVGMGGVFSWHGRWYNTFEKEEWAGLSLEQRQEYAELVTGEKLPVRSYYAPPSASKEAAVAEKSPTQPTVIEGYLNGQRVMGLDYDQDGIIDTLVMDAPDGQTYRVVDAAGDEGLDTMYRYDSLDGQLTAAIRLEHPFVLSNDDFSQGLERSMSQEVVDSILEPDEPTSTVPTDELSDEQYTANSEEPDDTYINDGNVRDMDE